MAKKNTDDLQTELRNARDLSQFLEQNKNRFHDMNFAARLEEMITRSGLTKAVLAERSGMSEVYLYQVLSGKRNPTRTRIICLCIGLGAALEETQELLGISGNAILYPRSRSDAIIMYGILNKMDIFQINDALYRQDENTLV